MYKLYYDSFPGNRVLFDKLVEKVPSSRNYFWQGNISFFASILTTLGVEYEYVSNTKDPDTIVVVDIDSQSNENIFKIIEIVSKEYKKAIVAISTELPTGFDAEYVKNHVASIYPNVFLVFTGDHVFNKELLSTSNLMVFPFYLINSLTRNIHVKYHCIPNCNLITSEKKYDYNHLMCNWTFAKYHMHYALHEYTESWRQLFSYQPPLITSKSLKIETDGAKALTFIQFNQTTTEYNMLVGLDDTGLYRKVFPKKDFLSRIKPFSINGFIEKRLDKDPMHLGDPTVGMLNLTHPEQVYKDCHLSVISETPGYNYYLDNTAENVHCNVITEKTMQPILNGHIFIAHSWGNPDYNSNYIKETLGFEIFNEIFDYDSISNSCNGAIAAYNIATQLSTFKKEMIFDNSKIIAEKLAYNLNRILNPNSGLRKDLKNAMEENILNKFISYQS